MLLWEALSQIQPPGDATNNGQAEQTPHCRRLPYDKRCAAYTKQGRRCKGKIRDNSEFCLFHDPAMRERLRRQSTADGMRRHRRLSHLPDGYLRKLTSRASIGGAMDRLYREVRLGIITPLMGNVLFNILTRILDSGFEDARRGVPPVRRTSKADRLRPRLQELLTRAERLAWRKAVAEAPATFLLPRGHSPQPALLPAATVDRVGPIELAGQVEARDLPRPLRQTAT